MIKPLLLFPLGLLVMSVTLRGEDPVSAVWSFQEVRDDLDSARRCEARPEVWMMPPWRSEPAGHIWRELFQHPDEWKNTRSCIDVLGCADWVMGTEFTDEELRAWLPMMETWRLKLGLEVGALKPGYPTGQSAFNRDIRYWQRIQSLGGRIYALAMDEPLSAARDSLKVRDGYAVEETAQFVALARRRYPDIRIGDIEPYPSITLADHLLWIDALQKRLSQMNVRGLDFYRLDVNWSNFIAANVPGNWMEVKKLESACHARKLPFSLIYWASGEPVLSKLGLADDSTWYVEIMGQGYDYKFVGGTPDQYVIESWIGMPSAGIPETAPWSFTRSVLDFCKRFVTSKSP